MGKYFCQEFRLFWSDAETEGCLFLLNFRFAKTTGIMSNVHVKIDLSFQQLTEIVKQLSPSEKLKFKVPIKQIEDWKLWLWYALKLFSVLATSIPKLNEFMSFNFQSVLVLTKNYKSCFGFRIKN